MSSALDFSLVGLVLLASAGYAVLALGPRTLRPRMYAWLSRLLARAPGWSGLGGIGRRLQAASAKAAAAGGCGTCASNPAAGAAPEVRISASKIGKRTAL